MNYMNTRFGQFVPETLMNPLIELERAFIGIKENESFKKEYILLPRVFRETHSIIF